MSSATPWLLLAAAIWLCGPVRRRARAAALAGGVRRTSVRALQLIVGTAATTVCIATLGPARGLLAAGFLAPAAGYLVRRLDERKVRAPPGRSLALSLDLVAAALRSGQPLPSALALAAPVAGRSTAAELAQVAGLLRLGADPAEAWRGLADDAVLAPVAQAARRSADSGARLARGLEQVAADIRAQVRATAQTRAHRAGVFAMAPLGLCFLPAFVCVGVVPVVVGIARDAFGALP